MDTASLVVDYVTPHGAGGVDQVSVLSTSEECYQVKLAFAIRFSEHTRGT